MGRWHSARSSCVLPGRIKVVPFFENKYAVPRDIKPGILKSTIRRGQSNFSIVYIFVSCEEKGCYRVVSVIQLSIDCCSYCGRSCRMQGIKEMITVDCNYKCWAFLGGGYGPST